MQTAAGAGGGLYLEVAVLRRRSYHLLFDARPQRIVPKKLQSSDMKLNGTCIMLLLIVCAFWTIGETLSCDQCGRECADICGTRQFRACCFNNMKKRQYDGGLKLWMRPRRYTIRLQPDYDV